MRRSQLSPVIAPVLAGLALAMACGRTGLELDEFERVAPRVHEVTPGDDAGSAQDAAPDGPTAVTPDAASDAQEDALSDAPFDDAAVDAPFDTALPDVTIDTAPPDVTSEDAPLDVPSEDAPADVSSEDAPADAPLDADADALPPSCTSQTVQYIYVVSKTHVLRTFDPATLTFATIGTLDCPSASTPYSMAVDRKGNAYVVFFDGTLFHVSTKTAACTPTSFAIGQDTFVKFGMGFSAELGTANEHLYVVGADTVTDLATIDTTSFALSPIGHVPDLGMELTGTGDGRLFGFYQDPNDASLSHIVALDKKTAAYQFAFPLPSIKLGTGWAFSFYGGKFWLFTAPSNSTVVSTYDPVTKVIATVASLDDVIVGAGVSTCAPTE